MGDSSIFFAKLPPIQQLCHVVLKISQDSFDFHLQILQCRQLLSACSQIIASPQMADKTLIDAVVHVEFYKKRFGFFCRKLNLKPLRASIASNLVVECCILYTVKYRLSPGWNQVGNVLVANVDFLACCGKIEAVTLDVSVRNDEMTVKLKPHLIRLPPPKLESFGICTEALEKFYADTDYVIPEGAINLQWCHILPSMKKGQVINISHKVPSNGACNTLLKDYEGLRKYWKIQYGYCLPESSDDMVFCSVYFMHLSSSLYTYPLICLRNRSIQYMPRSDGPTIIKKFFLDFRQKFHSICGLPLVYSSKACLALNRLSVASEIKPSVPQNVQVIDVKPSTSKSNQLQQVPNNDVIPSTQLSCDKDATNQTVPSSASVNKLSSFPITSEGRYIPVFGSKKSTVSSKKISNGMTQSQVTLANPSSVFEKRGAPRKSLPSLSKPELTEKQIVHPPPKPKKHRFDQLFVSAASGVQKDSNSKPSSFKNPQLNVKTCPKKACQFDNLFKPASKTY